MTFLLDRWRNAWNSDKLRKLSVHIFVLHVPLDWFSTLLALSAAKERGLAKSSGELNPLIGIAADSPIQLLVIMSLVGFGIVAMLWIEDWRIATGRSEMNRVGMTLVYFAVLIGIIIVCLNFAQWLSLKMVGV